MIEKITLNRNHVKEYTEGYAELQAENKRLLEVEKAKDALATENHDLNDEITRLREALGKIEKSSNATIQLLRESFVKTNLQSISKYCKAALKGGEK